MPGTSRENCETPYNPFVSFDFLNILEESGCAVRKTGWQGHHLRLENADGTLLGAVPCYVKSHSQGEYVFDHGWADAFERAGGRYYPKLQASVPFTPATGPRLLVNRNADAATVKAALAEGLKQVAEAVGVSSAHVTFAEEGDVAALEGAGFLRRTDQQFHFFNEGYASYDDFLATLASRKRKALKKERREALVPGITIDWLTGSDLTEKVWDDFFAFYMDTGGRKWGRPYLNRKFFSLIGERMAGDVLLVMAKRERPLHRRRDQLHRLAHALRPQLGLHRGPPVPAFRGLLPPGDRLRDRQGVESGRGRRSRRAQAGAGLQAGNDAIGAFHRACRAARRGLRLSEARATGSRAHGRISRRTRPVQKGWAPGQ